MGLFLNTVRKALEFKHHVQLYIDHEYKLFCDEAVVAVTQLGKGAERKVLLAVEYKPKVSPDLEDQMAWHLSETLLCHLIASFWAPFASVAKVFQLL